MSTLMMFYHTPEETIDVHAINNFLLFVGDHQLCFSDKIEHKHSDSMNKLIKTDQ